MKYKPANTYYVGSQDQYTVKLMGSQLPSYKVLGDKPISIDTAS